MSKSISRREFLKTSALSGVALGSGFIGSSGKAQLKKSDFGDAKNVIFLVSDGMSSGTLTLADQIKLNKYGKKTHWMDLYDSDRKYHRGLMDMASLSSVVTDSAAAASSWGCGKRINNGALNVGPENQAYKTICEIFRDSGKATGLVTTARITHATPAGFAINMSNRGMEDEIAAQYLDRGYDLLMGGGNRHFDAEMRSDGRDLYGDFEQGGYTVVKNKRELGMATRNSKLLGIFYDSHLPYTVDHQTLPELRDTIPSLAEMTASALERLQQNEDGFLLQVEGARVDHAAHGNDAAGMIYDQIAFDDAVKIVMDFTENREDTLVILTTDHGNANPGLSGMGSSYSSTPELFESLHNYQHSFEWMMNELYGQNDTTVSRIREVVEYAANTQITEPEARMVQKALQGEFDAPFNMRESTGSVLSGVLANYNGVYFMTTNHTSDYVELAAWGPGSDRLDSFVRNTELFDLMVDMAGVRAYAEG